MNSKGNAAYVEFIQQTLSALVTASWTEAAKIVKLGAGQANTVTSGTAISTFVKDKYPQAGSTGKHAAIYLGQDATGIQVLDQWKAQGDVRPRTIRWAPSKVGASGGRRIREAQRASRGSKNASPPPPVILAKGGDPKGHKQRQSQRTKLGLFATAPATTISP